ncbi:MAG TPA: YfiR family protein [Candidatus Berkiella sp.]|nr:YfiR family protein [Candidatus Berkiella sp.]
MKNSVRTRLLRLLTGSIVVSQLAIFSSSLFAGALPTAQDSEATSTGGNSEYSPESREYHLKAAFLRYVAKFVEWPESSLPESSINLCVLGQVPSFQGLNSINGKIVSDRTLSILKINKVSEAADNCQILFVTKTEQDNVKSILTAIENKPILGFGDMDGFAEAGGAMNFYIVNNRLAIMTNLPAVEKAGLQINPRMLRLVTIVPPIDQSSFDKGPPPDDKVEKMN